MILRVLFLLFWEVYEKFSLKRTYICDIIIIRKAHDRGGSLPTNQVTGIHRREVMLMFSFQDLIYFGMFILALLTYIDNRNKHK